jgi:CRP-like cAMP-binding protein
MSLRRRPLENLLLSALPADERDRLFRKLELCSLDAGQVLYEAGQVTQNVYFPLDAIVALMQVADTGASCAVAMVGYEGMVGVSLYLGGQAGSNRALVSSAGRAYRLAGSVLKDEFRRCAGLQELLLRYAQALFTQLAQTALCNRHHTVDQQLCRWLLLTHDRVRNDGFRATHELIAGMLGVRREGVSEAARRLHRLGAIDYSRGHVEVLDRARLEQRACECYAVVRRESQRLLLPRE